MFLGESLKNIDLKLQSYKSTPIILNTNLTNKPKFTSCNNERKSRQSILLHCSKPCTYQTLSIDYINEVYKNMLLNQNKNDLKDVIIIIIYVIKQ